MSSGEEDEARRIERRMLDAVSGFDAEALAFHTRLLLEARQLRGSRGVSRVFAPAAESSSDDDDDMDRDDLDDDEDGHGREDDDDDDDDDDGSVPVVRIIDDSDEDEEKDEEHKEEEDEEEEEEEVKPPVGFTRRFRKRRRMDVETWYKEMSAVTAEKDVVTDAVVMNFLAVSGFKDAAEAFARESGEKPTHALDSMEERAALRVAIERGDVETARQSVDAQLLRDHPSLAFRLLRQSFAELVAAGKAEEAIVFACNEMAPAAAENKEFLAQLEESMLLLAYPDPRNSPLAHHLSQQGREETARLLNEAILGDASPSVLSRALQRLFWAQDQLSPSTSIHVPPDQMLHARDILLPQPPSKQQRRAET